MTCMGGGMAEFHAICGAHNRELQQKMPSASTNTFVSQGYGAAVVRRLLEQLGWREALEGQPPQLYWVGSGQARSRVRPAQKPWQLVNGFPRAGSMGSKSSLLKNLRCYSMTTGAPPLESYFPRSYDLNKPRELYAFILDFAITRAEAVLRKVSARGAVMADCEAILGATHLLDRLTPALEQECAHLKGCMVTKWPPDDEIIRFVVAELEIVLYDRPPEVVYGSCAAPDPKSPQAALFAGLKMEMRWWLNHLDESPNRQRLLNGEQAFWILKEPSLNCGRGISVFSELVLLLAQAQTGGWDFVVQKYLERPLIIGPDRRKCDVRLWVLVTSWNPAVVWAWSEPYLRLAAKPFSWARDQVADPLVHLTNRAVAKKQKDDNPTDCGKPTVLDEDESHIWMLSKFFAWAAEAGLKTSQGSAARDRWTNYTWPRMLDAVRSCVRSTQVDVACHPPGCFELFGFDFLLDEDLEPWLLEANSSPDLCEDGGPSLRSLADGGLEELLKLVVALHQGAVELPHAQIGTPECDTLVNGSGRWRLCLHEVGQRAEKEMELRRILKPAASNVLRASLARQPGAAIQPDVVKTVLGASAANFLEEPPAAPAIQRGCTQPTGPALGRQRPRNSKLSRPSANYFVPTEPSPRNQALKAGLAEAKLFRLSAKSVVKRIFP